MYHIRDAELDSKKGEKIYTDDDQYYYWSRFPNILYKNHDTRCERIFKATDEELEAERIYAINHPYEKARSSRSYRTQQEKDSKAEVVKIITTILLCCYFIIIPFILALFDEPENLSDVFFVAFLGSVELAATAPVLIPVIIIFIAPLINSFIDWCFDASEKEKKFNKGITFGALTGWFLGRRK